MRATVRGGTRAVRHSRGPVSPGLERVRSAGTRRECQVIQREQTVIGEMDRGASRNRRIN